MGASGHNEIAPQTSSSCAAKKPRSRPIGRSRVGNLGFLPTADLQADLALRAAIIREIRGFQPDLVLTHRLWDYHPDHRAVAQAVQDACYLVTVPHIAADVPALRRDPVVAFMIDTFTRHQRFARM